MAKNCNQLLSVLLALFIMLGLLAGSANLVLASPAEPEHGYTPTAVAYSTDNVTSQSKNIMSQLPRRLCMAV